MPRAITSRSIRWSPRVIRRSVAFPAPRRSPRARMPGPDVGAAATRPSAASMSRSRPMAAASEPRLAALSPRAIPPRMPVWKNRRLVEDDWRVVADDSPLPQGDKVVVSLKRWRAERASLGARNAPLGLLIAAGEKWDDVVSDLARFPL